MILNESKQITVRKGKKGKLRFTVPLDFEVTDEYINDKVDNWRRTEFEEWLKNKGFFEERRGWSFYGDNDTDIKFPSTMCDEKTQTPYVKFHRIEGVKTFDLPHPAFSSFFDGSDYKSLNNFPDYLKAKWVSIHGVKEHELDFYEEILESGILLSETEFKIDDHYFIYLIKNDLIGKVEVDFNRFQEDVFKKLDPKMYHVLTSAKGINKYKL